jgi:putative MATE family efflux protein
MYNTKDSNEKNELRKSILLFTGPIVAELMLMSLISMVNLSMVGHLGAYALSAVGLTNQPVFIGVAVFQSFNVGATALISRFIGSKNYKSAKEVTIQTLMISVIFGAIIAVTSFIFSRDIVVFMGAKADTIEPSTMFMKYMGIGLFFQAIPTAAASILRGAGDSKSSMRFNIASNIINVIVGYLLINGVGSFPMLGLEGAAIGATSAKAAACIMSIYALFKTKLPIAISVKDKYKVNFKIIKRIAKIGVSSAGEQFAMRMGFLIYSKIIADLGTAPLAAHQIVNSVTSLCSGVISGMQMAASSFTGRSLGAEKPEMAEEYANEIRRMGLIFSTCVGASFFFFGRQLSSIFTSDPDVLQLSARVLKIAAFITFPQNSLSILSGCLRGAGDTTYPLISSLVGMIFARVSLAALFVLVFHLGLEGAWAAALIDQSVRSILIYLRFNSGKWKKVVI